KLRCVIAATKKAAARTCATAPTVIQATKGMLGERGGGGRREYGEEEDREWQSIEEADERCRQDTRGLGDAALHRIAHGLRRGGEQRDGNPQPRGGGEELGGQAPDYCRGGRGFVLLAGRRD